MERPTFACAAAAALISVPALTMTALADVGDGECDGARPSYSSDEYLSFGGGQIAAATQWRANDAQGVLNVYDLSGQTTAPLGVNWPTGVYSHPDWVRSQMGQVFGVALDDVGNIFTTHTAIYFSDTIGAIGGAPGQVYICDAFTGIPTVFATLPNNSDPVIAASNGVNESYPGLGNLCFDVNHQAVYVSNFEDGRIYRIDSTGTCLSTWDHASGLLSDCTPEAGDTEGAAPLGERVWAVQTFKDRCYYSVWVEDQGSPDPMFGNEIWSIALDASGEFIPNTQQLEIQVPVFANDWSNPVSDIAFGPLGQMMLAERTMETNQDTGFFTTAPHRSRALEYVCNDEMRWVPSGNDFSVGEGASMSADSAGGVDYSYAAAPDDRVWVTGDALILTSPGTPPNVYGLQGLPQSGGNADSSILIDLDIDIIEQDKSGLGSVEISCPDLILDDPCATVEVTEILCEPDDTGNYTVTFDLTNNSGQDVAYVLVVPQTPGVTVDPTGLVILPSILADGDSTDLTLTFNGGEPGEEVCFFFSLNTVDFEECCTVEPCITVPECDCAQIHDDRTICTSDGSGCFTYTFEVDNLTDDDIYYSFIVPISPVGVMLDTGNADPSRWDFSPVLMPNATDAMSITVCGAAPGEEVCFLLTLHNQTLEECCSIEVCVTAPDCEPQGIPCAADCNGDGVLDFFDVSAFLDEMANQVERADMNHDNAWDFFDLSIFLAAFAAGCP